MFITKYALSSGILELDGKVNGEYFRPSDLKFKYHLFHVRECFETREEAITDCEERRIKKLQSLDKQTKKISALKFI